MERKAPPPHHAPHPAVGHHAHDGAQSRRWLVLVAMTGSLSMIFVDMTVVGVALPRIGASLGMDDAAQGWIVTAYLLTLASLMALGGRLGDLMGKVRAFVAGVVLFAIASAVCAAAREGGMLIAGRVLQGVAACLMQPASGALVIGAFAPGERGKAMAAYVGIPLVFMAIGPAAGGAIVEHWGWPWVFWLNLPIAAAAVALTLAARPRDARSHDRHIDWLGGALLLAGLPAFVFGIQQLGPERGDAAPGVSPRTLAALVGGATVLALFVRRQWNHPRPLLRLRLFADHALAADAITIACMQFAMTGLVIAGSLYAQDVLCYTPMQAGLSLLPMLAPVILVVHVAGRWYDRAGVRAPAAWGTGLATVGMLVQAGGAWAQSYPVMAVGMFVLGLGIAFTMSPTNTDALGRVPHSDRGQVSGLVQTLRQVGGSVGVAVVAATVALSLAAFERGSGDLRHDDVARIRSMLRSGDAKARIDAAGDPELFERVRTASAHSYAVGYGVASLGTLGAFVVVRRWMNPGKAAPVTSPVAASR
jgi:EmrB/QacA subfamily drug resistance transporter